MKIFNLQEYKNKKIGKDAAKLLNDYLVNCSMDNAIPIVKLAKKFDIKVYSKKMDKEIAAKLYINGPTKEIYGYDKVIIVNNKYTKYMQRFFVARELAYYLFNVTKNPDLADRKKQIKDTYDLNKPTDMYEQHAINILLPDFSFCPQFLTASSYLDSYFTATYLSKFFEVPKGAVYQKMKKL